MPADPRSLGILGGTFNPPHLGHLALARHAREELGLDLVVLMPAHASPHKLIREGRPDEAGEHDPGPEHRLRMCRLAVSGDPALAVCAAEIERGGASYTVDTITAIHAHHPNTALTFILGADTACTLPSWREPAKLLELAQLAVAARAGSARTRVLDALGSLGVSGAGGAVAAEQSGAGRGGAARGVRFLQMPAIDVSSSLARQRAGEGRALEELVGRAVAEYIAEHHLYRAGIEVAS